VQSHLRGEEGVQHEDEGLVDIQISLDNGDHNLFEGSVEVNNEQESDQVEHIEKKNESDEEEYSDNEENASYVISDRETT